MTGDIEMSIDFDLLKENINDVKKSKLNSKNSILEVLEGLYGLREELEDERDSVEVTFFQT